MIMGTENITDQATATAALEKIRDELVLATNRQSATTDELHRVIVKFRPQGVVSVDEMADAIDRDRNYIDSVWSSYGDTAKGKQTRVKVDASEAVWRAQMGNLTRAATEQRRAANDVPVIRAERDRIVALVYAAKILGPSAIAAAVGVDRNHVLRIARKAGLAPVWRKNAKNQYTTKAK